jgi:tetratricopeptide (TPR) repeat protein
MLDRNALTWNDDKKVAAFVSAKDASVMAISKNVAAVVSDSTTNAVNRMLAYGMGIHSALPHLGIRYVPDPKTPYSALSASSDTVDYVQYPRQTLYYRSGDCDDLSILYCSLLESIAVETAFITVPGHIYMAFSLGVGGTDAARSFIAMDDLIIRDDGTAWVPIEVTMIGASFLEAWEEGAKQWREYDPQGLAGFYRVHDAWEHYEPVGISGGVEGITLPDTIAMRESFLDEYTRYVSQSIYDRVAGIETVMAQEGESPRLLNRLGVLYASYGVYEKARPYFERAARDSSYLPALLNLGNLSYLDSEYETALTYFNRAHEVSHDNPQVILSLAKVNHELENFGTARKQYDQLVQLDPKLAEQHVYLNSRAEEAVRASAAAMDREVIWAAEEE